MLAAWTVADRTERLKAADAERTTGDVASAAALEATITGMERDRWLVGLLVLGSLAVGDYLFRCHDLVM